MSTLREFAGSDFLKKRKYTEEEIGQRRDEALPELLKAVEKVIASPDKTKEKWERRYDRKEAIRQLRMLYHLYSAEYAPSQMEKSLTNILMSGDRTVKPGAYQGIRALIVEERKDE